MNKKILISGLLLFVTAGLITAQAVFDDVFEQEFVSNGATDTKTSFSGDITLPSAPEDWTDENDFSYLFLDDDGDALPEDSEISGFLTGEFDSSLWSNDFTGEIHFGQLDNDLVIHGPNDAIQSSFFVGFNLCLSDPNDPDSPRTEKGLYLENGSYLSSDLWGKVYLTNTAALDLPSEFLADGFKTYFCPNSGELFLTIGSEILGLITFNPEIVLSVNLEKYLRFGFSGVGLGEISDLEDAGASLNFEENTDLAFLNTRLNLFSFWTDINRNVREITRNTPAENPSDTLIDRSLGTSGIEQVFWYDFRDTTGSKTIDGNSGEIVTMTGTNDIIDIDGKNTLIIEGGNLYIDADMQYSDYDNDLLVVVVRRDPNNPENGGNLYVNPEVRNLVGTFIIEGAMMNYDPAHGTDDGLVPFYVNNDGDNLYPDNVPFVKKQLYIYGSLLSANTVGGSFISGVTAISAEDRCPFGTDIEKQGRACDTKEAAKYDLASMRYVRFQNAGSTEIDEHTSCPYGSYAPNVFLPEDNKALAGRRCSTEDNAESNLRISSRTNIYHSVFIEYNPSVVYSDSPIVNTLLQTGRQFVSESVRSGDSDQ